MEGKTLASAAAAAAMSDRTARTWKDGLLPSQTKEARDWRTRPDPFSEVWDTDVVPLLEADETGRLEPRRSSRFWAAVPRPVRGGPVADHAATGAASDTVWRCSLGRSDRGLSARPGPSERSVP